MCKYCSFTFTNEEEKITRGDNIIKIKDGRNLLDVYLFRYHTNDGDSRLNQIALDRCVEVETGELVDVESHVIDIKYCPFCGEEL